MSKRRGKVKDVGAMKLRKKRRRGEKCKKCILNCIIIMGIVEEKKNTKEIEEE